jgi:hypothetical protein
MMGDYLTDSEIEELLQEPKPLPVDYRRRLALKPKRGHSEVELELTGTAGSAFHLIARQSSANRLDFSVILAYCPPQSHQLFRLRRYNGKSHEHSNPLEGEVFYDFHIHKATERYQTSGYREDTYAERTDRYADVHQAIECLLADCALQPPPDSEMPLFKRTE